MFELLVLLMVLQPSMDKFVDFDAWTVDRNQNGIPDLSVITINGIYRTTIIGTDNDEDGLLDSGLVDTDDDRKLDALWIDSNEDGRPTKHELEQIMIEIPFVDIPTTIQIFREEFYHTTFWSVVYYSDNGKLLFIERFVDSNQDEIADSYKFISGASNTKVLTMIDIDYNGTYNMICHKEECSNLNDSETISQAKQSEFPTLKFKTTKTNH
jgi:hypothetical protein